MPGDLVALAADRIPRGAVHIMRWLRRRIERATTVPSYAPRTLMDYSNRELREVIGDLRIANSDLTRDLNEARMQLVIAQGGSPLDALRAQFPAL